MRAAIFLSSLLLAFPVFAIERGINYDPAHSVIFTKAQAANNIGTMKEEVSKDFTILKNAGFTAVKTFYSSLSTIDGQRSFNFADLACPAGLRLMLGVFEFNPDRDNCANWCEKATEIQVEKAIESAKQYPNCIIGIVVGNEDIYNWNFTQPNRAMQARIAKDITTIKQALTGLNIRVGSAQQDGAWLKLANDDPNDIIGKIDFLGANIYPFWSPQQPDVQAAQTEFNNRYEAIKNHAKFKEKEVIVTEEGWPSHSSDAQNPHASLLAEQQYYQWWQSRAGSDSFDSYYFSIFDKQPVDADADKYFGLCTYDRQNKIITVCDSI
ncbi:hypothetical protein [Legionella israelensis]|uniref:Endo-1,3-beta-glucanase btgC n=1 Tax=Legionella israelensis TaxID=454 RepID=A0A0W0V5J0_9GAMM|nr:hypothetical protein [Legionella israelensis]KTD14969.1 hypothetical protein Lisr_2314 [Legionella israelensis]QBS10033.1 hypothetical protein E4T55_09305 [Legionella israelensis]SCX78510.1 Exo-beta-1,3-glucanase, GH17 family [Legionella israelensis DSM 19235]STX59615.1 Exo-beta-1,3-glucanase [Legionella israelensis]